MRHSSSIVKMADTDFPKELEKFNILTPEFKKNFIVEKSKIFANTECFVNIDLNDYDEDLIIESVDYYLLPGIITVTLTEDNTKSWTLPFDFKVKLMKPSDFQEHGKTLIFNYTPGELIIEQKSYPLSYDVGVMEQLLEGQAKYINTPELLTLSLMRYIGGVDLNILETIVQNMFRDSVNPMKPARLTDYSNFQIFGQKKLPFVTSWVNALAFENELTFSLILF